MSSRASTAQVTESTFLSLLWAGTGVSLCFVVFRLFVKLKSFRKLYSDDFLVIAAWAMLLGTAVLWQVDAPTLYEQYAVEAGQRPSSPGFVDRDTKFLRTEVLFAYFFYCCLWLIKLSFLLFFRRLGSKIVRARQIWWWCILVVTAITWAVCIANIHYRCFLASFDSIMSYCPSSAASHFENSTFYFNCAADVITDCLIISIPVWMLWDVRLPRRKKLILTAIFSLTVVVMIVSVFRGVLAHSTKKKVDTSWLYLWSNTEMITSIIIACVASFRQLFVIAKKPNQVAKPSVSTPRGGRLPCFRSGGKPSSEVSSYKKRPTFHNKHQDASQIWGSRVHIVPLDSIHVSHRIDFSTGISG